MKCFIFPILFGALFQSVNVVVAAPVTRAAGSIVTSTDSNQPAVATTTNREDIFAFTSWEPKDATSPDSELSKRDSLPIFAKEAREPSKKRNDQIFAVIGWEPEEPESSSSSAAVTAAATVV